MLSPLLPMMRIGIAFCGTHSGMSWHRTWNSGRSYRVRGSLYTLHRTALYVRTDWDVVHLSYWPRYPIELHFHQPLSLRQPLVRYTCLETCAWPCSCCSCLCFQLWWIWGNFLKHKIRNTYLCLRFFLSFQSHNYQHARRHVTRKRWPTCVVCVNKHLRTVAKRQHSARRSWISRNLKSNVSK